MRPLHTWLIAGGGLGLLFAAMAWATWSLARMESTQHRMAAEAAVQERARLALWRMESLALALVVEESARPPEQYRAGADGAVSPLLGQSPGRVRLYFELDADGRARSPQAPETEAEKQAAQRLELPPATLELSLTRLEELRALLKEQAPEESRKLVEQREPAPVRRTASLMDNRAFLQEWNTVPAAPVNRSFGVETPRALAETSPVPPPPPAYEPPRVASALKPGSARELQQSMNEKEALFRQSQVAEATRNAVSRYNYQHGESAAAEIAQAEAAPPPSSSLAPAPEVAMRSVAPPPLVTRGGEDASPADPAARGEPERPAMASRKQTPPEAEATGADSPAVAGKAPETPALAKAEQPENASAAAADSIAFSANVETGAGEADREKQDNALQFYGRPPSGAPAPSPVLTVSDFKPLWIRDALLLTRRVTDAAGASVVQGAWIDWPALRAELLRAVGDLFPAAALEPALPEHNGEGDRSRLLASLPVRFLPGALETPPPAFWTPLKLSLAAAWACVFLAAAAVAAVLRGMVLLSERRASFVSSVTHELRTPLATFKLYSELLADGLVREETKRQRYLETLSAEADRLGHLVENVLSWSRLEGGRGPSCRAPVVPAEFCARLESRLRQRAAQARAELTIDCAPDAPVFPSAAAAVEQIIFNLVDNACKYGGRGEEPPRVTVRVTGERGRVVFAVCDQGRGILKSEARRLFRPFHKSAREAAHSAPGVGLGLALCRRLAAELGGVLEIDGDRSEGACFLLKLPA